MKWNGTSLAAGLAIAGGIILSAGIIASMMSYGGIHSESYSLANHFISELGWRKAAPLAPFFNWGLVIGCIVCLPMMCALGRHLRTHLGYAGMLCGIFMLIAGASAGLFPMDNMKPHLVAAFCFFWSYLFAMVFFSMAFSPSLNKNSSIPMVAAGIACCIVAVTFLAFPKQSVVSAIRDLRGFQRPQIWWLAMLEWLVLVSAWLWGTTAILVLCRSELAQGKK